MGVPVFISYSSRDVDFILGEVKPLLQAAACFKIILDLDEFRWGEDPAKNMEDAVRNSAFTIAIITQAYVDGDWSMFEAMEASILSRLIPIVFQMPTKVPTKLRERHSYGLALDPSDWDAAFERLLTYIGVPASDAKQTLLRRGPRNRPSLRCRVRHLNTQKRINEFLDTQTAINNPANTLRPTLQGDIVFEGVDFIYPNTGIQALSHFNLEIKKGQKVAIVGHTGSGKTTIAQLLLRMYDPTHGRITIDGVDLRNMDLQELRRQISYVPQDVFLFSDTITNNILFSPAGGSDDWVRQAARYASVEKEIEGFHSKYDTMIGERGVTLSGGQKQRISIARALAKNPQLVVFDDCLSAVDARTEKEILHNLGLFLENKTAIIITHRIFTLFDFDIIVVLEDGKIIETGTHNELLSRKGYYSYLYEQQQQQDREEGK